MKRILRLCLVALLIAGGLWVAQPSPIDPVAWTPPHNTPLVGPWAPNEQLEQAELIAQGQVEGPEATAINPQGVVYAGTADGWIAY